MEINILKTENGSYVLRTAKRCVSVSISIKENNLTEINKSKMLVGIFKLMTEYENNFPEVKV